MELENVQMLNDVETNKENKENKENELATEAVVDFNTLTKDELLKVLDQKQVSIKNYMQHVENTEASYKIEIENLTKFYEEQIKKLRNILEYYERKFKLIMEIINIEKGGEK